jgi:Nif-specific regulatory protein
MPPSLIALAGPLRGDVLPLPEVGLTIGRDAANDLHPGDLSLSRRHCTFSIENSRVIIADLDSVNGTFVNGVPVKRRILDHGDHVKIGESVFLFLQREPATATTLVQAEGPSHEPTAQLAKADVLDLQSDRMIEAFPAALREGRTLEGLLRLTRALAAASTADMVRQTLSDGLFDLVPAEQAAIIWTSDGEPDVASAYVRSRAGGTAVPISRTVVARVLADGIAVVSHDTSLDEALRAARSIVDSRTRSVLCVPMMRAGRVDGALYLAIGGDSAAFTADDLQLVTAVAGAAALAFDNVRHIEGLERDISALRAEFDAGRSLVLVGESAAMRQVYTFIGKASRTDSTVLILGETGTGKAMAARDIHRNSPRASRPFVAINASEIAETLLESELFGHEKGAFTGAIGQKKGKLEVAEGGTIFLDEIGDLSAAVQVKLLRVLQEREFTRVGGTRPISMDVRFIAATNKDLDAAVKSGAFRQDLFYRLNVVTVRMPPLRERPDDIPLLAALFAMRYAERCKRRITGITADARACLMRYPWPGNVRELENAIERAVVLGCTDRIAPEDLPDSVLEAESGGGHAPTDYHQAVQDAKKRIVLDALERASGQRVDAAKSLGLHPNNLSRLIRHLGLTSVADRLSPPRTRSQRP